jgi:hypothetical protein
MVRGGIRMFLARLHFFGQNTSATVAAGRSKSNCHKFNSQAREKEGAGELRRSDQGVQSKICPYIPIRHLVAII